MTLRQVSVATKRNNTLKGRAIQLRMKRTLDCVLSGAGLVLASPVLALSALAICCEDGRPVLFRHRRPGKDGEPFEVIKFRSMIKNADEQLNTDGGVHQDRITRVGKVLRRTSIDELPQFVNILRGEMSFVGPRPALMEHLPRYSSVQRGRLRMRPGITGLAQVSGRNTLPWTRRIELDNHYVDHFSLMLDLRIITKTVWVIVTGAGQVEDRNPGDVDDLALPNPHFTSNHDPERDEMRNHQKSPSLETVACYLCKATEFRPWASENGYTLVSCDGCSLLYVNPRPSSEDVASAHLQGVHAGTETIDTTGGFSRSVLPRYEKALDDLIPTGLQGQPRRWLDIGCGHGEFLTVLTRRFGDAIEAVGSEPNVKKRESAAQRGLDVRHLDLDAHTDRYDYVSLLNVYSHIPDPVAELSKWKQLLRPHGRLILQTGDVGSLSAELLPRPLLLPDHLSFVTERQLRDVLDAAGFDVEMVAKYPMMRWSCATVAKEATKILLPGYRSRLRDLKRLQHYRELDMYLMATPRS